MLRIVRTLSQRAVTARAGVELGYIRHIHGGAKYLLRITFPQPPYDMQVVHEVDGARYQPLGRHGLQARVVRDSVVPVVLRLST